MIQDSKLMNNNLIFGIIIYITYRNKFKAKNFMDLGSYTDHEKAGYGFKSIVSENLSDTTFHLINKIYKTNDLFLKAILFICFLGSGGFCCFLTIKTFIDYFSYGVLTSTKTISEIPADCK
jgi:hypothetical protein